MLSLLAAFEQITHADVAFGGVLEILQEAGAGRESVDDGQVFPIGKQSGIGAEIRRDFSRLALLNGSPGGQQTVIVLSGDLDRFFKSDFRSGGSLAEAPS